jgi:hypothetical protein
MKKHLFLILMASIVLFSCSKEKMEPENNDKDLIFVSELNCYMPSHFFEYERIFVDKLPDEQTLLASHNSSKKSGPLTMPVPGGRIIDGNIRIVGSTGGYEEVSLTLNAGWIVTGVGALISSSSNNYTVLLLERRYVYSDGSMSPRYISWDEDRSYVEPARCEVWCSVPTNTLAVGLG